MSSIGFVALHIESSSRHLFSTINCHQILWICSLSSYPHISRVGVASNSDCDKRKLIQQQLILLFHATKCKNSNAYNSCQINHCDVMKRVMQHMPTCSDGKNCTVPHCASSKQIIFHWKSCQKTDCGVCQPLRQKGQTSGDAQGQW